MAQPLLMEKWETIPEYQNYEASNLGRIRNARTKRVIKQKPHPSTQYLEVNLSTDGKTKTLSVHRLIAKTFLAFHDDRMFVNHIDSNRQNNKITNLEWCTPSENAQHMAKQDHANGGMYRVCYWCYTLSGKLIKMYSSTLELEKDGYKCESLRKALCQGRAYKGCLWKKSITKVRIVGQYDRAGNLIRVYYGGASEVIAENEGYNKYSIHKASRGERKYYRGFVWKYLN